MFRIFVSVGLALAIAAIPASASAARSRPGGHAALLDVFPPEQMTCGKRGWTFAAMVNGRVPATACVLKYKNNAGFTPFGAL